MTPTETFRRAAGGVFPCPVDPLPTTFRATFTASLPSELVELLSAISKRGVNVSRGVEQPIRSWAVKTARELNETSRKQRRKCVDS